MRRRKPDSMELQQMKAAAKEEKQRRQVQRNRLAREKQLREEAERERANMEQRLLQYQEEIRLANEALVCKFRFYFPIVSIFLSIQRRSEESADLLAEKSRVAEEEAMLLSQKAAEAEQEITRIRLSAMRTEEEKVCGVQHQILLYVHFIICFQVTLERKTREAEILTARLVEESERRAAEANKLKEELLRARAAEKQAKEKLLDFLSRSTSYNTSVTASPISSVTNLYHTGPLSPQFGPDLTVLEPPETSVSPDLNLNSYDLIAHADADQLSLEIEKERVDYLEKSKHLQHQLQELRSEIAVLKVGEKQTELDHLHEEQVKLGENKYSTLKKSKSGSTKSRVAFFEEL